MKRNSTLVKGCLAFIDTAFSGLVPVKVLSVTDHKPKTGIVFDLTKGPNTSQYHKVKVQVTKDHFGYRRGELIESNSVNVVPRGCIKGRAIWAYNILFD